MEENMNVKELKIITSVISDNMEIWVEINGKKIPIVDYDWELEDNRIVLKA